MALHGRACHSGGMLPEFEDFPSRPLNHGRVYDVHRRTRCVAYLVEDAELRPLGAVEGVICFAFVEYGADELPRKVGTWFGAFHPDDLLEAMETCRAGLDPDAPRPMHRPLRELVEDRLSSRPQYRIDIHDSNR